MTLLDSLIGTYDVRTRHTTTVAAPPERVWKALQAFRPAGDSSTLTRALFRLRGLRAAGGTLSEALKAEGFAPLGETPGRELVFGVAGRFWALREQRALQRVGDAGGFRSFNAPGCAAAAFSIGVEATNAGTTLLTTETRVRCVDRAARRRFRAYWTIVGPFSGLIRRDWLRSIKRIAETL